MVIKTIIFFFQLAVAIPLNIIAGLFCWFIALFVNKDTGQLPYLLRWFETPDTSYNGFIGGVYDEMWMAENPTWSKYKIALSWIARNPAYTYNMFCAPNIEPHPLFKQYGNLNIADGENGVAGWFLIAIDGWWNLSFVWQIPFTNRCMRGDYGWNLKPYVANYESKMLGALQVTLPVRFYSFGIIGK
jgi:hypothetical protein